MIETRRLKNVLIFIQTILSFLLANSIECEQVYASWAEPPKKGAF